MTPPRPQRLVHPTRPGDLLKRFGDQAAPVVRKDDGERDSDYLAKIRQCRCLKSGETPCEAAHVRFASAAFGKASGMGKKPADRWALPLTAYWHRLARDAQHNRNEQAFWHEVGISPLLLCAELYAVRHDLEAMQMTVEKAIAGRGR